ncbi:MAG: dicarboxylate/amino acid:cation symporter [Epsilonproteobacteria bacterium]|nr:dicarboxylate/amino acid:cation symporter [Campylobacterota bacterium]
MKQVKKNFSLWFDLPAWVKSIVGMILGLALGCTLGEKATVLRPVGTMFINAIMMMVVPVVFVSLVCGVLSMKDPVKMGRVALKTFILYITTMALGSVIALFLSSVVFKPGLGVTLNNLSKKLIDVKQMPTVSFVDMVVDMVPSNVFGAFAQGNILQIIFFALIFGVAINLCGRKGRPVEYMFESLSVVIFKLVNLVMSFAPYGIFALMADVAGSHGLDVIAALMNMVGVIYLCMAIVIFGVYTIGLLMVGLNPIPFFKKMIEAQAIAFSTTSSAAALPVNLRVAEYKLGVHNNIASFVLPLGSTVNMNGLSTYMGVIAVFAANLYGIELSLADMVSVVFTSVIAAIGCAGVPAAGLIVMPMVLSSVKIPLGVIGIIAAVNRVIDMVSTTANITGDTFTAVLVARSEGELELDVYNNGVTNGD